MASRSPRLQTIEIPISCKVAPTKRASGARVSLSDMITRFDRLLSANTVITVLFRDSVRDGIGNLLKARLETAAKLAMNPVIHIGLSNKKRREEIAELKDALRAAREKLAKLVNKQTKTYRAVKERIQRLEGRLDRKYAKRDDEGTAKNQTSADAGKAFGGRIKTLASLLYENPDLRLTWRGQKALGGFIHRPTLDLEKISDRYKKTRSEQLGPDVTPNSLWRLLEFGSGQFAKAGKRLASNRGTKVKDGGGMWVLNKTFIRGHRPGNVLRDQQMNEYSEYETNIVIKFTDYLEAYLRTGVYKL